MMEPEKRDEIEEEYGMPPGRLMYHFYVEQDMSSGQIAQEMGESRHTVKHWLQNSGIKMRSRTLTDVQRILIISRLASGMGDGSTASAVGCGKSTVRRYRKDLEATGRPVDISLDLDPKDRSVISDLIIQAVGEPDSPESISDCTAESD